MNRVQNDLASRVANLFGQYSAAKDRADRFRTSILPTANRWNLSEKAYKAGQLEYLRVVQAQRTFLDAVLEYTCALSDAWRAASEISGLLLDENWLHSEASKDPPTP